MGRSKEKRGHEDFANGINMPMDQTSPRERFIHAVLAAIDLEDVAATYSRVIHQGPHALTFCPCHEGVTPCMTIENYQQVARCWLCLAQGDAIWLVTEHEDICYRDAARILAKKAGIEEPADIEWQAEDLQRPRATPDSQRRSLSLKSFAPPRRLRI